MGKDEKAYTSCRSTQEHISYRGKHRVCKAECLKNFRYCAQGQVHQGRYREFEEEFANQFQ